MGLFKSSLLYCLTMNGYDNLTASTHVRKALTRARKF